MSRYRIYRWGSILAAQSWVPDFRKAITSPFRCRSRPSAIGIGPNTNLILAWARSSASMMALLFLTTTLPSASTRTAVPMDETSTPDSHDSLMARAFARINADDFTGAAALIKSALAIRSTPAVWQLLGITWKECGEKTK